MFAIENTDRYKIWLNQFVDGDRKVVSKLASALVYVHHEEFYKGLFSTIHKCANTFSGNVALYAIREKIDEPYFPHDSNTGNILKGKKPSSVQSESEIGSEGEIAHVCRDFSKSNRNKILNHPSLKQLKYKKCKGIILIDDVIGSGKRSSEFAKWLYENKTIKSWISLKYIKMKVVSFWGSDYGLSRVREERCVEDVIVDRRGGFDPGVFGQRQIDEFKVICRKYACHTSRENMACGFDGAFTNIVLPHKCPNTNPAILWAANGKKWQSLFPTRPEMVFQPLPKTTIHEQITKYLNILGHTRLLNSRQFGRMSHEVQQLQALLSLLSANKRRDPILCEVLGKSIPEIYEMLRLCEKFEWINNNRFLTNQGRIMIRRFRVSKKNENKTPPLKEAFYFPKSYSRGSANVI